MYLYRKKIIFNYLIVKYFHLIIKHKLIYCYITKIDNLKIIINIYYLIKKFIHLV